MAAPTRKRARALTSTLTMTALVPVRNRKGATGTIAPPANRTNDVPAAAPRRAPEFLRINAQFLACQSIQGTVFIGHQLGCDGFCFVLGETLGLIDQSQLLLLLLRDCLDLLCLDSKLTLVEFTGTLHREPLSHRHRAGAGEQPRQ